MKRLLAIAVACTALACNAETYTNGMTIRLAVGDSVYHQLKSAWKLSGSTNTFWSWATGTETNVVAGSTNVVHVNVKIVLSDATGATLANQTMILGVRVSQLGAGPKDSTILTRIKTAVEPQEGD